MAIQKEKKNNNMKKIQIILFFIIAFAIMLFFINGILAATPNITSIQISPIPAFANNNLNCSFNISDKDFGIIWDTEVRPTTSQILAVYCDSDFCYAGDANGYFLKINATSGMQIYNITDNISRPTTNQIYALTCDSIYCYAVDAAGYFLQINKATGAHVHNRTSNISYWSTTSIDSLSCDSDFCYGGDSNGYFLKLNKTSGVHVYNLSTNYQNRWSAYGIYGMACDNNFCYGASVNYFLKINKTSGVQIYNTTTGYINQLGIYYGLYCDSDFCYGTDTNGYFDKINKTSGVHVYNSSNGYINQISDTFIYTGVLCEGDFCYGVDNNGYFLKVNKTSGKHVFNKSFGYTFRWSNYSFSAYHPFYCNNSYCYGGDYQGNFLKMNEAGDSLNAYASWYKNSVFNLSYIVTDLKNDTAAIAQLMSFNLTKNNNWTCSIMPYVRAANGSMINGTSANASIIINNSAPIIKFIDIASPVYSNMTPVGIVSYMDYDNENSIIYYQWYVNGVNVENDTITNAPYNSLVYSYLNQTLYLGQTINLSIFANDGTVNSTLTNWGKIIFNATGNSQVPLSTSNFNGIDCDSDFCYGGDFNGYFVKVNKTSGKQIFNLSAGYISQLTNNRINAMACDSNFCYAGDNSGYFLKVNKTSGAQIYNTTAGYVSRLSFNSINSLFCDSDFCYGGDSSGYFLKINKTSGKHVYNGTAGYISQLGSNINSIFCDSDFCYGTDSSGNFLKLNKTSGVHVFNATTNYRNQWSTYNIYGMSCDNDFCYAGDYQGDFLKINKTSGKHIFNTSNGYINQPGNIAIYGMTCDTDFCYGADYSGIFFKVNKTSGVHVFNISTGYVYKIASSISTNQFIKCDYSYCYLSDYYGNFLKEYKASSVIIQQGTFAANATTPLVVNISSLDSTNSVSLDLICTTVLQNPNSRPMNATVLWSKNGINNSIFYYNNSYSNNYNFNASLYNKNLSVGDNWSCAIQYFDGNVTSAFYNSSNIMIVADSFPPVLSIVSPINTLYYSPRIDFIVSAYEDLSFCKYSLDNFTTNFTMQISSNLRTANYTNQNVSVGNNTAKFWCNDSYGNANTTQVNFILTGNSLPYVSYINMTPSNPYRTNNLSCVFVLNDSDFGIIWNNEIQLTSSYIHSIYCDSDFCYSGDGSGYFLKLNKTSGVQIFNTSAGYIDRLSTNSIYSLYCDSDFCYGLDTSGYFLKVNKTSGLQIFNLSTGFISKPTSNIVYGISCDSDFCYGLDASGYFLKINKTSGVHVYNTTAGYTNQPSNTNIFGIDCDSDFCYSSDFNGYFLKINKTSGVHVYNITANYTNYWGGSTIYAIDCDSDFCYGTDYSGYFLKINKTSGVQIYNHSTGYKILWGNATISAISCDNTFCYAADNDGYFLKIYKATGVQIFNKTIGYDFKWTYSSYFGLYGTFPCDNNYCYEGDGNGNFLKMKKDGNLLGAYYTWQKNGIINSSNYISNIKAGTNNSLSVLSGNLVKNDNWTCQITPYDGLTTGTMLFSIATVNDTLPVFNWLDISQPIYSNQTPMAYAYYTDIDNDNATVYFKWFVNGVNVENDSAANVAPNSFASAILNKPVYTNQTINVSVYAFDGSLNSQEKFWDKLIWNQSGISVMNLSNTSIYGISCNTDFCYGTDSGGYFLKVNKTSGQKIYNKTAGYLDRLTTGSINGFSCDNDYCYAADNSGYFLKVNKTSGVQIYNLSTGYINKPGTVNIYGLYCDSDFCYLTDQNGYFLELNKTSGVHVFNRSAGYTRYFGGNTVPDFVSCDSDFCYGSDGAGYFLKINKTSGVNVINSTMNISKPSTNTLYQISCDNDFCYMGDSQGYFIKINKTSGVHIYNTTANYRNQPTSTSNYLIGIYCDNDYCFGSDSAGYFIKINKTSGVHIYNISAGYTYKWADSIANMQFLSCDNSYCYSGNNAGNLLKASKSATIVVLSGTFDANATMPLNININSLDNTNSTSLDLICSSVLQNPNERAMNLTLAWIKNGITNMTFYFNNSYPNLYSFNASLRYKNLTAGDNWSCAIKYFDGIVNSNWSFSANITIRNDSFPPIISIISPLAVYYYNPMINFLITAYEDFGYAILSLNNFITNYTMPLSSNLRTANLTLYNVSVGNQNAKFWYNDSYGNYNISEVNFTEIKNNVPNASLVVISPSNPNKTVNLNCTFSISDSDYALAWGTGDKQLSSINIYSSYCDSDFCYAVDANSYFLKINKTSGQMIFNRSANYQDFLNASTIYNLYCDSDYCYAIDYYGYFIKANKTSGAHVYNRTAGYIAGLNSTYSNNLICDSDFCYAIDNNGYFIKANKTSGAQVFNETSGYSLRVYSSGLTALSCDSDFCYTTDSSGYFIKFNKTSGVYVFNSSSGYKVQWTTSSMNDIYCDSDYCYAGDWSGYFIKVNKTSGQQIFNRSSGFNVSWDTANIYAISCDNNFCYGVDYYGYFLKINKTSGANIFDKTTGRAFKISATGFYFYNYLPCDSDNCYAGDQSGYFYKVNKTGDKLGAYYSWYKNNGNATISNYTDVRANYNNSIMLGSGNLTKNDNWTCQIIPYDGWTNGTAISATATILSTPAAINWVDILQPVYTNQTPVMQAFVSDIDNDNGTFYCNWYANGVNIENDSVFNLSSNGIVFAYLNKNLTNYTGQTLNASVYFYDGLFNSSVKSWDKLIWNANGTSSNKLTTNSIYGTYCDSDFCYAGDSVGYFLKLNKTSGFNIFNMSIGYMSNWTNSSIYDISCDSDFCYGADGSGLFLKINKTSGMQVYNASNSARNQLSNTTIIAISCDSNFCYGVDQYGYFLEVNKTSGVHVYNKSSGYINRWSNMTINNLYCDSDFCYGGDSLGYFLKINKTSGVQIFNRSNGYSNRLTTVNFYSIYCDSDFCYGGDSSGYFLKLNKTSGVHLINTTGTIIRPSTVQLFSLYCDSTYCYSKDASGYFIKVNKVNGMQAYNQSSGYIYMLSTPNQYSKIQCDNSYCYMGDNNGYYTKNSKTAIITILGTDIQPPNILLTYPLNNSFSKPNISFIFNASDNVNVANCTIYINSTLNQTKANITNGNLSSFNFNLSNGAYNWSINCSDTSSNTAQTETRVVIIDSIIPSITLELPGNNTITTNLTINFSANITDSYNLSNATIYIYNQSNLVQYQNTTNISGITALIAMPITLSQGIYKWFFSVFDLAGNQGLSSTNKTLIIDSTPPNIILNMPANGTVTRNTLINFSANMSDNIMITNATFYLYNSSGIAVNSSFFAINSANYNASYSKNLSEGVYLWQFNALDIALNNYTAQNFTLTIDITAPYIVNITSPANGFSTSMPTPFISFNISDNLANIIRYQVYADNILTSTDSINYTSNLQITTIKILSALSIGNHTIKIQAYDEANNSANSSAINITIAPPVVYLNFPPYNSYYNSNSINFAFNVTDLDFTSLNCTLYIDDNLNITNPATPRNITINWSVSGILEGNHNWSVFCVNNGSINTTDKWKFGIDQTNPWIIFGNGTFSSGSFENKGDIYMSAFPNDSLSGISRVIFYLYNTTALVRYNITSPGSFYYNFSGLLDGIYFYNATAVDNAGNSNFSETRNITIDRVLPGINLGFPLNGTITNNITVNFSANLSDNYYVANATLYIYNSSNVLIMQNFSSATGANTSAAIVVSLFDGTYSWQYSLYDVSGNLNYSENRTLFIDTNAPNLTLAYPANGITVANGMINFSANITDSYMLGNASVFVYNQTGDFVNSSWSLASGFSQIIGIPINLVSGIYTWFYTAFDFAGNLGISQNQTVSVDLSQINFSIISPQDKLSFKNGSIVNFSASISADSSLLNASIVVYYPNGNIYNRTLINISGNNSTVINASMRLYGDSLNWSIEAYKQNGVKGTSNNFTISLIEIGGNINHHVFLGEDIFGNGTIMNITLANLTINGNGHVIYGNGSGFGFIANSPNVTIKNLTIANVGIGVYGKSANSLKIQNLNIVNSTNYAIIAYNYSSIEVRDIILDNDRDYLNMTGTYADYYNITFMNSNGKINYNYFNNSNSIDVKRSNLNISANKIFVNSSSIRDLNVSSQITINNPIGKSVYADYLDNSNYSLCTGCLITNYNPMIFNASHFTSYISGANSQLFIWDENDLNMPYANFSKKAGQITMFFANYTNISAGAEISNASCAAWFNDSGWASMNFNSTKGIYEYSRIFGSSGTYSYNITCNSTDFDYLGGNDSILIIQANMTIILTSPGNGTITNNISNNFTANLTSNAGLYNTSVFVYNQSGILVMQNSTNLSGLFAVVGMPIILADGIYNWFYLAFDIIGNNFATQNYTLNIDTTAPAILFVSPTTGNNSISRNNSILINATIYDMNFKNVTIYVNESSFFCNLSYCSNSSLNLYSFGGNSYGAYINYSLLIKGNYSFYASSCDILSQCNLTQTRIYSFDNIHPNITIFSPIATAYINESMNFSVQTDKSSSCIFTFDNWNSSYNMNPSGNNFFNYTLNMTEGYWTANFSCNDSLGNIGYNSIRFSVDLHPPAIFLNSPVNGTIANYSISLFNYSVIGGGNISTCQLWANWAGNWQANASNFSIISDGSANYFNTNGISDGYYKWSIWCNSTLGTGKWPMQGNNTILIDRSIPLAVLISPGNGNLSHNESHNFTAIINDTTSGIANASLYIYNSTSIVYSGARNFSLMQTFGIVLGITKALSEGFYYWYYSVFDWAGNYYATSNNTLNITDIVHSLYFTYTTGGYANYANGTGISGDVSYIDSYDLNGTLSHANTTSDSADGFYYITHAYSKVRQGETMRNLGKLYSQNLWGETIFKAGDSQSEIDKNITLNNSLVEIIYPLNGSYASPVLFNASLAGVSNFSNCYLNLINNASNIPMQINSSSTILSYNLSAGNYSYFISCNLDSGFIANTTAINFSVIITSIQMNVNITISPVDANTMNFSWPAVNTADGYKIWYSDDVNFIKTINASTNLSSSNITLIGNSNVSFVDGGLLGVAKRYYAIAAYSGNLLGFSNDRYYALKGNLTGTGNTEGNMIALPGNSSANISKIILLASPGDTITTYSNGAWLASIYDGANWQGDFNMIVPGQGYWTSSLANSQNITEFGNIVSGNTSQIISKTDSDNRGNFIGIATTGTKSISNLIPLPSSEDSIVYYEKGWKIAIRIMNSWRGDFNTLQAGKGYWISKLGVNQNVNYGE